LEIDVLRPQFMPAEMVEQWRILQAETPGLDSPFLSPHWPRAVERAQQGLDRGLRVAVMHQGGRPRGFIAVRAEGPAAMPAGAPMCDYQAVVAEPDASLDPRRLVHALGVGRLDFSHMMAGQEAFAPYAKGHTNSWIVDVAEGYDAYVAERRGAGVMAFKDLDKKRRKAERENGPVTFSAHARGQADFDQLFAWKREQLRATGQTDIFAIDWTRRLMRELFESRESDFGGVLFALHIGDRLAAAHFHLRGAAVIHAWMIAHDPEFERYSPGLLLFQDILRWMDGTPYRRLDLGQGDYRFKRELSNAQQGIMHGYVGIPSPAAFMRGAVYSVRRAAEALPLGRVSELPGKAMRRMDLLRGLR